VSVRREALAVVIVLAAMAALLESGRQGDGLTNDEILYIAAAHRYWAASDFRLNPTMPPLAKIVIGTGLLGGGWIDPERGPGDDEMSWSYRFVHEANDAGRLLRRARVPVMIVALLVALMVWAWTRAAAGAAAALVALVLAAFHPTLLAHGHLATTDVVAAAAMLAASWSCWRWCRAPSARPAILTGLALGAAVSTRLTGWLLAPCLAALALTAGLRSAAAAPTPRQRASFLLALAALVPLVLWAAHGFHRRPWTEATSTGAAPPPAHAVATALVPDVYLEGIRYQIGHGTEGHPAYLLGERSHTGWRRYFLVAFAVKNTPGFLLATLAGLAAAAGVWRRRGDRRTLVHCALPAAVLFLAATLQHIDIGERYILPVYPYLIVLIAVSTAGWRERRPARVAAAAVLALHVVPAVAAARGGHLTYFNVLAGGPAGGHRVLLDSNLDWGQDLPRLAAWMRSHGVRSVQLGYHGSDRPGRLGIESEDLPGVTLYPPHPPARPFQGVVAVSPNLLLRLFPRLGDPYAALRDRPPDARAGVFFVYFLDGRPRPVGVPSGP
jgi:4-amino-4-deoxy-L-arabinose transferase-like glycosyltransferase